MNNILVFERPISNRVFRRVIRLVHGASRITGISSFKGCSELWSGAYLYDTALDGVDDVLAPQLDDIICRDRSTTIMDRERAVRLVSRFWNGARALFERERFDYFYTLNIDCYEIDVLLRLCGLYGVQAVSFVGSFLSGYAWITLRGERNDLGRTVSEEEVDRVVESLLDVAYLPSSETENVRRHSGDIWAFYHRRMLIERVYNPIRKIVDGDPDNEHYNQHLFQGLTYSDLYTADFDSHFSRVSELDIESESTVYYPMHLIPEATTSYWCQDIARQGYETYVLSLIKGADEGVRFLIKEHPAMLGKRRISFYDELASMSGVSVVHPLDRSNELLARVDTVLVDNGTVGVEALARGKRVLAVEDNYYNALHPNAHRVERVTWEGLRAPVIGYDPRAFVTDLLRGLFPSDYRNDRAQNDCSAEQLASGVRLFLASTSGDVC